MYNSCKKRIKAIKTFTMFSLLTDSRQLQAMDTITKNHKSPRHFTTGKWSPTARDNLDN